MSAATVTDWRRRIRENGIALVESVTAGNVVATLLANMQQRSAVLWRIASKTETTAPRVAIAALDGLRKEDQHVAGMADTLGILDCFSARRSEPEDPLALPHMAKEFLEELGTLFRGEPSSEEHAVIDLHDTADAISDDGGEQPAS